MSTFSDRLGIGRNAELLQIRSCDVELRKAVWNAFYGSLPKNEPGTRAYGASAWIAQYFYYNLLNEPIDEVPVYENDRRDVLKNYLLSCEWNFVYDFIEVANKCFARTEMQEKFAKYVNSALQRECSGYRMVDGMVVEITSELDQKSLASAMLEIPYAGPRQHIRRAAELLFDRTSPDPRNSIKESISAVEGMARIITNDPSATLGLALKNIEHTHSIHPALKDAFSKLYGYSSDGDGIRHGMLEDSKIGFSEAKYMLLSCSAFINYLVEAKA